MWYGFHLRKIKPAKATLAQTELEGNVMDICREIGKESSDNLFSKHEKNTLAPVKLAGINQTNMKIHSGSVWLHCGTWCCKLI